MIINTILLYIEFHKKFVLHNSNFDMVEWIETNYAISPKKYALLLPLISKSKQMEMEHSHKTTTNQVTKLMLNKNKPASIFIH